jgi:DNA-binding beta-propeller fold protein YncE
MRSDASTVPRRPRPPRAAIILVAVAALAGPTEALGAPTPTPSRQVPTAVGTLTQLSGPTGCLVDGSKPSGGCTPARALRGPGPFLGSQAVAIDPAGRNVYVASSRSNAIAIFRRSPQTGVLTQASGRAGCIAVGGASGCATAVGLRGPNSVAVSPDGRSVYATSLESDAITTFRRNRATGALVQGPTGTGCIAAAPIPGCAQGRALDGPDVVTVSPDGGSVYVGSFLGDAVASFVRDRSTGALTQPAGVSGCIGGAPADGCAPGIALDAPEGMAISGDGDNVYVASAVSNALDVFARDPATGALTQATDGTGCIATTPLTGCASGVQLAGANAVAVSPSGGDVYVSSLLSNSVTSFTHSATGQLTQKTGTSGCVVFLLAVGCSLGREMSAPEGLAVAPDGADVYVAAFTSGAIDDLVRDADSGALIQKPRRPGCLTGGVTRDCLPGRRLLGASSLAVSPDGAYLYSAAFAGNAVGVFKRVTRSR